MRDRQNYGKTREDRAENTVTLRSQSGEEIDFEEIAGIAYQGGYYAILRPVELLPGMESDEAMVFRVTRGADAGDRYEIEMDDAVIDAVFAEYQKLYDECMRGGY